MRPRLSNPQIPYGKLLTLNLTKKHLSSPEYVATCVVRIREFSGLCEAGHLTNLAHQAQLTLAKAIRKALLYAEKNVSGDKEFEAKLKDFCLPKAVDLLHDVALIVWRFPKKGENNHEIQTGCSLLVLDFIAYLQHEFHSAIQIMGKSPHGERLTHLRLAIGVSAGSVSEVYLAEKGNSIYSGRVVEESFCCEKRAAPCGVVVNLNLAPYHLLERCCFRPGIIDQIQLEKGRQITVWTTATESIEWRRARGKFSDSAAVKKLIDQPYDKLSSIADRPLTRHDTVSIFEIRALIESGYAASLASMNRAKALSVQDLQKVKQTILGMEGGRFREHATSDLDKKLLALAKDFHICIAYMAEKKASRRKINTLLMRKLYNCTQPVLSFRVRRILPNKVIEHHTSIFEAIFQSNSKLAAHEMYTHVLYHIIEAQKAINAATKPIYFAGCGEA